MIDTRSFRSFLALILVLFPAFLHATTTQSLSEKDQNLVSQGEIIVREVPTDAQAGRTFEAIGLIDASRATVVRVLTAYESYPEFMPNVSHIDVVDQHDNEAVLDYTLTLPLGKVKKYRLKISASDPAADYSLIQWHLLERPELKAEGTIKNTTGYWRVEERKPHCSLVLYHVYTDPGLVPLGVGWIVDVLSKNSVPQALLRTKARAEEIAKDPGSGKGQ
ncbi:MAG: SRPBCC family protein [Deltaproteobacteria bacterium]